MDGFQKRTLEKRKAILDTSLRLFNKYGYKNITISQISKQAHVSLDTIYSYFGSKDNLKKELIKEIVDEYCDIVNKIVTSEASATEKLEKIILSKLDFSKQFSRQFLTEELKDLNELDLFEGEEKEKFLHNVIEKIIKQGIDEHSITTEVSSQSVLVCFEIVQYYITHNLSSLLQISNNESLLKEIWFLFMNGLKGR